MKIQKQPKTIGRLHDWLDYFAKAFDSFEWHISDIYSRE